MPQDVVDIGHCLCLLQTVLATLLPFTLMAALFPNRIVCHAYELPSGAAGSHADQPYHVPDLRSKPPSGHFMRTVDLVLEEVAVALRGLYLMALFSPAILAAPFVFYLGIGREQWMHLLRWTLEQAGPAFIKWGQWASTRPDMFPKDVCNSLESLQSSAPSHPGHFSRAAVEAAFGKKLGDVFSYWEDVPIASGSIAQIHRARLSPAAAAHCRQPPGTLVAVKVRHPKVSTLMARDFVLMARAAAASSRLPGVKQLRLDESVRQFGGPLQEQLNLAVEAANLSRFAHNFRRWRNVKFPTPLYPLVRPDVLVESFEHGNVIKRYVKSDSPAQEKLAEEIAETGLNAYLQMLLKDNFIHADMHPGNILIREVDRSSKWSARLYQVLQVAGLGHWPFLTAAIQPANASPQLVLLDTGMIAELSKDDQHNVVNFFKVLSTTHSC